MVKKLKWPYRWNGGGRNLRRGTEHRRSRNKGGVQVGGDAFLEHRGSQKDRT